MTTNKKFSPKLWANINTADKIRTVAHRIVEMGIDITAGYNRWRNIAFGISLEMGEEGRSIFHDISRFNAEYDHQKCDKLYDNCLKRLADSTNHSGIKIGTFFDYAQEAGVDIKITNAHCGIAPAYDVPLLANSARDAKLANLANSANSANEHEIPEGTIPLPTFSDKVNEDLPPILRDVTAQGKSSTEKDMLLLSAIALLSAVFPEVFAIYDNMRVFANLFIFIVANAASGKGRTTACLKLISLIEQEVRDANKQEEEDYQQQLAEIRAMGSKNAAAMPTPKEPPYRSMLIPANCSSTAIYQALHDNHDQGITFETEADSLANTLKSDYGNFSDGLRKGFHHEDITYRRRKENEHVEIHNPKWTVYLTGTPGQVSNLIPSPENGLFSRFLFMKVEVPAKWHNVFSKAKHTIDEEMEAIGKRVFAIHQYLSSCGKEGIQFELTEEQGERFNSFFDSLVEEYKNMLGRDFVASIYRLGLSTFRIAMVLSITRLEDSLPVGDASTANVHSAPTTITCQDQDLESAITIADTLIQHAARIFATLMPDKEGDDIMGVRLNPKSEKLFSSLPDKFTRQMVLGISKKLGIPQRTAEKYVGEYVNKHALCKRTGNGEYEKITATTQQSAS